MKTFVISGGNSGIGLEAGRQLVAKGHRVVLLGRDPAKGQAALELLKVGPGAADFHAVDLSTHAGVNVAADKVLAAHPKLDGALLGAGVLTMQDKRTSDDLHQVFAVNYLSRYHLGQRLLPALKGQPPGKVVLLVARVSLNTTIDFDAFPRFKPFPGMSALSAIQISNFHWVAHLAKSEPGVLAAVTNVGLSKTEILRETPWLMRTGFNVLSPLIAVSVETAASNAVHLLTSEGWPSGAYWPKPGKPDQVTPLALDSKVTERVVESSRQLTGA
jgi:NAD(P)-dependent dehydrogenase (short-subunit alcohol dehydrogenase family)